MNEGQFPEPTFTPPGWQPPTASGLDARPHLLEGRHWVSFDRLHWWNGAMWVPGPPPAQPPPASPISPSAGVGAVATIVGLIAFVLLAVVAIGVWMSMQQSGIPGAPAP